MHQRKHSRRTHRTNGPVRDDSPRRLRWIATLFSLVVVIALALVAADRSGVAPRLLAEHIQQRSSDHGDWIATPAHLASRMLWRLDRGDGLPQMVLPDWAGARPGPASALTEADKVVNSADELVAAVAAVRPGETITLAPGRYRFTGSALEAQQAGSESAPITVRSQTLGTVTLEFDQLEGFRVTAPYWRFENLTIRGVCSNHDRCEHAFHVEGQGHHVVIRNNVISDFNAHIKINGHEGRFPDAGRIINNTLTQTAPRRTAAPVTPIDLVAASRWTIEGNLITDFIKLGGDRTSFGAFAKAAGSGVVFLRNVVICEHRLRGAPGRRIGLSFGGGGGSPAGCRDRRCVVEHEDGLMASNLIASCSDEGIYVNRAPRSRIIHNTVLDTAGIDVRYPESSVQVTANLIDGPVRVRDGAILDESENATSPLWGLYLGWHRVRNVFADAEALDLRFATPPPRTGISLPLPDLCGKPWRQPAAVGAFEDFAPCLQARLNPAA